MKKTLMIAAALAVLAASASTATNAEGLTGCCKKPLRAEGLQHLKKPLRMCNQNLCHVKRPLRGGSGTIHIDASDIWHRPL